MEADDDHGMEAARPRGAHRPEPPQRGLARSRPAVPAEYRVRRGRSPAPAASASGGRSLQPPQDVQLPQRPGEYRPVNPRPARAGAELKPEPSHPSGYLKACPGELGDRVTGKPERNFGHDERTRQVADQRGVRNHEGHDGSPVPAASHAVLAWSLISPQSLAIALGDMSGQRDSSQRR